MFAGHLAEVKVQASVAGDQAHSPGLGRPHANKEPQALEYLAMEAGSATRLPGVKDQPASEDGGTPGKM